MDDEAAALGTLIGERVRLERKRRSWTLDQLAQRSGVSRRMLVTIEQGATNPSIATLLRLSDALGVGLPALVAPAPQSSVSVTRKADRAALWSSEAGGVAYLAAGTEPPDFAVELRDWHLGPGDDHRSEAHSAGTREPRRPSCQLCGCASGRTPGTCAWGTPPHSPLTSPTGTPTPVPAPPVSV